MPGQTTYWRNNISSLAWEFLPQDDLENVAGKSDVCSPPSPVVFMTQPQIRSRKLMNIARFLFGLIKYDVGFVLSFFHVWISMKARVWKTICNDAT